MAPRETLPPCSVTGKPCRWLSEEWYDDAGEMTAWDNFCEDCGAWRDWTKDECQEPTDTAPSNG